MTVLNKQPNKKITEKKKEKIVKFWANVSDSDSEKQRLNKNSCFTMTHLVRKFCFFILFKLLSL